MKRLVCLCVTLALAIAGEAYAQGPDLTRGTTLNALAGGTFTSTTQQGNFGGAFGWELAPRVSLETTMKWLVPDNGAEAFSAIVTAQVPLVTGRKIVPFLVAGAGANRATYDLSQNNVPEFYRNRANEVGAVEGAHKSFLDPAIVFGGGISFFATRHISLRPEVEVMTVWNAGKTYTTTSAAVRFAYHFELHRVTPALRSPKAR
jgi:hypothetical protein